MTEQNDMKLTKKDLLRMADDVESVLQHLQATNHTLNLIPNRSHINQDDLSIYYVSLSELASDNFHYNQKLIKKLDRILSFLIEPDDEENIAYIRNEVDY